MEEYEKTKDAKKQKKRRERKKASSLLITLMLVFGCIIVSLGKSTLTISAASTNVKVGDAWYTVLSEKSGTAQYKKPAKKNLKTADIPNTVKIGNKDYKVTQVAGDAFKGNKSLKNITVLGNVLKIGKRAFYGCKNLKSVTVKTKKLSKKSVGKDAFKGLHPKAIIAVPTDKVASYHSIFGLAGFSGDKQKMKGMVDASASFFDPKFCSFGIGSGDGSGTQYTVGDTVTFQSKVGFLPALYGHWEEDPRMLVHGFHRCANCGQCFSDLMYAVHNSLQFVSGGCWCNYFLGSGDGKKGPSTWAFISDSAPCSTTFQYVLPDGLSYKEGSVEVVDWAFGDNVTGSCHINTSGNHITVSIDDVKSIPFYYPFDTERYKRNLYYDGYGHREGFPSSIVVKFDAVVSEKASPEVTVSASTSYSYKGAQQSESYNATIRTASLQVSNTDADGMALSGAEFDLYKMETEYMEGTNLGSSDWRLVASGLHAGDVVGALGAGFDRFGNEYKLVQTKAPDGYQVALPFEFELNIADDGTVTAKDEDGSRLDVVDGVIQVCVVNAAKKSGTKATGAKDKGNKTTEAAKDTGGSKNGSSVSGNASTGDSAGKNSAPAASSGKKRVKARATYYKDGVRDLSMTFDEVVDPTVTVIDAKEISNRAYMYKGYRLDKITLNGEEVNSLPKKVADGSEIGYYYVSQ